MDGWIRTVQELMGHKTIQVTLRYAHLGPQHQLEAVQRLCDTGLALSRTTDTGTDTGTSEPSTVNTERPNQAVYQQRIKRSRAYSSMVRAADS
jgi:hypothetical protein